MPHILMKGTKHKIACIEEEGPHHKLSLVRVERDDWMNRPMMPRRQPARAKSSMKFLMHNLQQEQRKTGTRAEQ